MIVKNILRYWATDDADVLDAFLATANERYTMLEVALKPISQAVEDLERDWTIRPNEYWMAMAGNLMGLRDATKACLVLFSRERSSEATPVAMVVAATAPSYTYALYNLLEMLGQAGIVLTAYSAVCLSMERKHLRQRQDVLCALREVDQLAREAITVGREEIDLAPMVHVRLLSSPAVPTVRERYIARRIRQEVQA